MESYNNYHPNNNLQKLYKDYQGIAPEKAKFIFWGIDANFDEDIHTKYDLCKNHIYKYLQNGEEYLCKLLNEITDSSNVFHHPSIKDCNNQKVDGKTYHSRYKSFYESKEIKLIKEIILSTCFTEAIPFLTYGTFPINDYKKEHKHELIENFYSKLDRIVSNDVAKIICVCPYILDNILNSKNERKLFSNINLPEEIFQTKNKFISYKLEGFDNIYISRVYHFSTNRKKNGYGCESDVIAFQDLFDNEIKRIFYTKKVDSTQ